MEGVVGKTAFATGSLRVSERSRITTVNSAGGRRAVAAGVCAFYFFYFGSAEEAD